MNLKTKGFCLLIAIIIFILVGIVVTFRSKSYVISYKVGDYTIEEKFDSDTKYYALAVEIDDRIYKMFVEKKAVRKKKVIKDVAILSNDDESCVLMKSEKIETYPVCYKGDELVDYDLLENKDEDFYKRESLEMTDVEYNGMTFKNLDHNYFIWNYRGYYFINGQERTKIDFLEKESYQNNLAYSDGQYLMTPNYDQEYNFTEVYVINMKNGKINKWDLKEEISYNSYFLGDVDGEVYLVDRKNKKEYKLNFKKKRIERADKDGMGITYEEGFKRVSISKLVSDNYEFKKSDMVEYSLEDGALNRTGKDERDKTIISKEKVDKVIYYKGDLVYYLAGDKVYNYSTKYGENLTFVHTELNFNNKNSVFIY